MEADITCPGCGRVNQAHSQTNGRGSPDPGSVGICWACHTISVYDHTAYGQLYQRLPTAEEKAEIEADPNVRNALAAMRAAADPVQAVEALRGSN